MLQLSSILNSFINLSAFRFFKKCCATQLDDGHLHQQLMERLRLQIDGPALRLMTLNTYKKLLRYCNSIQY